jgi:3-deoxy-manno-octulosonate cytidylyltransferase (CMP-KDO synthetase)
LKVSIIIPSRMASTRLPGKPLEDILGKSLIRRVYEQASRSALAHEVLVATDHPDIYHHVLAFGGKAVMTSEKHISGTDRIGEVAQMSDSDIFINVQGDEPLIDPGQIDELISKFKISEVEIATQKIIITSTEDLFDYNTVKVLTAKNDCALYFSRQAIPGHRDLPYRKWIDHSDYYRHVGIYGFRKKTLLELIALQPSSLERAETLEQLRWLENGYTIHCFETAYTSFGVDTPEDLEKVVHLILRDMNR